MSKKLYLPVTITRKWLKNKFNACDDGLNQFEQKFPNGLKTHADVLKDIDYQLLDWFLGLVCKELNLDHYNYAENTQAVTAGILENTTWKYRKKQELISNVIKVKVPKIITLKFLESIGACWDSRNTFRNLFGTLKADTTVENLAKFRVDHIRYLAYLLDRNRHEPNGFYQYIKDEMAAVRFITYDDDSHRLKVAQIFMAGVEISD